MKFIYLLFSFFLLSSVASMAQTTKQELFDTPEKTGGVYYAYPTDLKPQTATPKGYEPFYISHFGRHGSRYLIGDNDYKVVLDLLRDADKENALSSLGKDVLDRLNKVWAEAEGRGGDLSPLGVRQQRGIAERMYKSFPQVFPKGADISARSTIVVRCVLTMDAFCERLKELEPTLKTSRDASNKYMSYLNNHTKEAVAFRYAKDGWGEEYSKFEEQHMHPERLANAIFSDPSFILKRVNLKNFMWGMYWIASGMQNIETPVSFYDVFEKQELFDLWQCVNYRHYVKDGNSALSKGVMMGNCKPLLKNILDGADEAINKNDKGATLRFGHDGNVIPLAMLLHLDGCYESISETADFYKVWSDFRVVPMAANIQIVFFKKKGSDDVIVKFLHNEKETSIPVKSDILPYYHWKDVKAYYQSLLEDTKE